MLNGFGNEVMTIGLCARDGNEEMPLFYTTRINVHASNVHISISEAVKDFYILEQFT